MNADQSSDQIRAVKGDDKCALKSEHLGGSIWVVVNLQVLEQQKWCRGKRGIV